MFNMQKFRRDTCRKCSGALYVLKWAKKKPRTCGGCADAYRQAKQARAALAKVKGRA